MATITSEPKAFNSLLICATNNTGSASTMFLAEGTGARERRLDHTVGWAGLICKSNSVADCQASVLQALGFLLHIQFVLHGGLHGRTKAL